MFAFWNVSVFVVNIIEIPDPIPPKYEWARNCPASAKPFLLRSAPISSPSAQLETVAATAMSHKANLPTRDDRDKDRHRDRDRDHGRRDEDRDRDRERGTEMAREIQRPCEGER